MEAGVDPLFKVLTEAQSNRVLSEAFESWLRANLEAPPEGLRRSLRRSSRWSSGHEDGGPIERLKRAAIELNQWRDCRTPWTREPFDRSAVIARLVELVQALAMVTAKASSQRDNLFVDTAPVRAVSEEIRRNDAAGLERDDDGLESRLVELARNKDWLRARKGSGATFAPGIPRTAVLEARDGLLAALHDFRERADADLAATLQVELFECLDQYESRKEQEGALDFLDLLVRARNLVRDDDTVRAHFQRRFSRIFVDEFQDTDPLQAELLLLLAADDAAQKDWTRVVPVAGKLFLVGDPKQSIYRFRRADLGVYRDVCEQLQRAGARRIPLRRSFRSVPAIQRFVNASFELVMDGSVERQQADYVPLGESRSDEAGQPAVVALPVPSPYGAQFISAPRIEQSLPEAVGAFVHWLVRSSGWSVTERRGGETERVPVAERHVCILFRRFVSFDRDITRPYVDALEARGIRHLLVGGRSFHAREEIDTLRAALMAVEWPDDELSVFATLRGALFAIGDEELLEYHHRGGRFHPFRTRPVVPGRLAPITEALDYLRGLHVQRNRRSVADTVSDLLSHTRAHVAFVLRPNGEQALANVLHVAELARQYELDGGMSFRGFVDSIRHETDTRAAEAPILEEGSDGVRLMTVHKAKGLEFPVVILADITARLTPYEVGRAVEAENGLCALRLAGWAPRDLLDRQEAERGREEAEGERVAYVAATRARDLLVVAGVGDSPWDTGWVSPLNRGLYPPDTRRRDGEPAIGCPAFTSRDTVLERPNGDPASPTTVAPGRYQLGEVQAPYDVVWWSPEPKVLTLGARPNIGLRREDLVVKDVSPLVRERYLNEYRAWQSGKNDAIVRASVPMIDVRTVTAAAADESLLLDTGDVEVVRVEVDPARPRGMRFGSLVHALLADVPLLENEPGTMASAVSLDSLAEAHGRLLGATVEEIVAARHAVTRALGHRLLRKAAAATASGTCFRETPVVHRLPGGVLVEGTVDLAFEDADGMIVIDFKTEDAVGEALETYRRQVRIYASAVADATGRPTTGVLMRI